MFLAYIGSKSTGTTSQMRFSGTCFQFKADFIKSAAFSRPNPNLEFTLKPAPFVFHPTLAASESYWDVHATRCCMSRQVRFGLASKTKAKMPAASGAAAEVPV